MTDVSRETTDTPRPEWEPLDLEPIKARAEQATEGPWLPAHDIEKHEPTEITDESTWVVTWPGMDLFDGLSTGYERFRREDAEFIAHVRADVPALVAEVELLRETLREIQRATGRIVVLTMTRTPRVPDDPEALARYKAELEEKIAEREKESRDE